MIIDNLKIKLLMCIGVVSLLLLLCYSIDMDKADKNITINNTNSSIGNIATIKSDEYIGFNNTTSTIVVKSSDKIHTHGSGKNKLPLITITAKPSVVSGYQYRWYTMTWVNYCPICHRYGTLHNAHKWQARFEQELTCSYCDSDFCGVTGKNKYDWSYVYLIKKY